MVVVRRACTFAQLASRSGAIRHSGDEKEGDEDLGEGDDESTSRVHPRRHIAASPHHRCLLHPYHRHPHTVTLLPPSPPLWCHRRYALSLRLSLRTLATHPHYALSLRTLSTRALNALSACASVITVDLRHVPSSVCALLFIGTVATEGYTFKDVKTARMRLVDWRTGVETCRYFPALAGAGVPMCRLAYCCRAFCWS